MMYNRIKCYIEQHDMFYSSQYGFRKSHSTEHAILDIVETIQNCGVFIDLKKLLTILLNKLNFYGFQGIINEWFSLYDP